MKKLVLFVATAACMGLLAMPAYATSGTYVRDPIISPSREDIPTVPELPDPNDPDSPDVVILIEDDVPKTYYRVKNPDTGLYEYILDEDVPLAVTSPQTGDAQAQPLLLTGLLGLGAAGLFVAYRKNAVE